MSKERGDDKSAAGKASLSAHDEITATNHMAGDRPILIEAFDPISEKTSLQADVSSREAENFSRNFETELSPLRRLSIGTHYRLIEAQGRFFHLLERERELHTHFNFMPVFLGIGMLFYFIAPAEPSVIASCLTAAVLLVISHRIKTHSILRSALLAFSLMMSGLALSTFQTGFFATKQIEREMTAEINGVIVGVSQTRRGAPRYVIKPTLIEGVEKSDLPEKIRLSTASKKYAILQIGQSISGKARLQPVSGPAYPGGYDFSFFAWYEQIGGSGFFYGAPKGGDFIKPNGWMERIDRYSKNLRLKIRERITNAVPDEGGDIAVALITGDRSGLDASTQESLRQSGLAHILAISGLHMALVSLTVITIIRIAASFFPNFVMRHDVKKWAVAGGFVAATLYLGISGASIATQRAWIMVCVMLLAVLLDRKAITMRSVAIAAILILLIKPSSILMPGFQMSFAAVAMLVAIYELWQNRKKITQFSNPNENFIFGKFKTGLGYFSGLGMTSLIAGAATFLFSAYHFNAVASLGLVANLLAMPIVSLLVMPLALFTMILMPYGLEAWALKPMSQATLLVVDISNWVNSFGSQVITGKMNFGFFVLFSAAMVVFAAMRTRLRVIAALPALLAVVWLWTDHSDNQRFPDILIAENGRTIALANGEGKAAYLYPGRSKFIRDIWQKAWPDAFDEHERDRTKKAKACNKDMCERLLESGERLFVVYDPKQIKPACEKADILLAPRLWWVNCRKRQPALVLKRGDFEQYGAHAIYLGNSKTGPKDTKFAYAIERSLNSNQRPWNRVVTPK